MAGPNRQNLTRGRNTVASGVSRNIPALTRLTATTRGAR